MAANLSHGHADYKRGAHSPARRRCHVMRRGVVPDRLVAGHLDLGCERAKGDPTNLDPWTNRQPEKNSQLKLDLS
jgi:hypothetical protein